MSRPSTAADLTTDLEYIQTIPNKEAFQPIMLAVYRFGRIAKRDKPFRASFSYSGRIQRLDILCYIY